MFDQAFITNPYPTYRLLRDAGPSHWFGDFLGGAWLFPRYAEIAPALRDARFSARRSHCYTGLLPAGVRDDFGDFDRVFSLWLLFLDHPEHSTLRKLMNRGFAPQVIEACREAIVATARSLIDGFAGNTSIDFMKEFAHPFPAIVISELMGVPAADRSQFIEWSDDLARFFGNPASSRDDAYRARNSLLALTRYFDEVIDERRRRQGSDLVSLLLRIEEDGEILTPEKVTAQCSMLMFGGHETTRNLLGNGMLALLRHPEQLHALRQDPALIPNAVKELLRYDSPVQYLARIATEDFEFAGATIKKGQMLIPLIASANRDPGRFRDADALDILRQDNGHLAFGHGPHVCIGTRLALLEAEVAFRILLERFPWIGLAEAEPVWSPNFGFRGLESLHLTVHTADLSALCA